MLRANVGVYSDCHGLAVYLCLGYLVSVAAGNYEGLSGCAGCRLVVHVDANNKLAAFNRCFHGVAFLFGCGLWVLVLPYSLNLLTCCRVCKRGASSLHVRACYVKAGVGALRLLLSCCSSGRGCAGLPLCLFRRCLSQMYGWGGRVVSSARE